MLIVFAERAHDEQGGKNGQRDGDGHNQRAAPTAKEQQNQRSGQAGGNNRLPQNPVHCGADEDGLIAG